MLIQGKKQVKFRFGIFHIGSQQDLIIDIVKDIPNNSINNLDIDEIQGDLEEELTGERSQKIDVQDVLFHDALLMEWNYVIEDVQMFTRDSDKSEWIQYDEIADIQKWNLDRM